jgi:molybdenum storage protein
MSERFAVGDGRVHLRTGLMGESLVDRSCLDATEGGREQALLPGAAVVGIGGHSIMDRGRAAVFPLVDEIVAARAEHQLVLSVSGGARTRHTYHIALDLGLPTGALALLAGACEEQNAAMLHALLAPHGAVVVARTDFSSLPGYVAAGLLPILCSMPPYREWEPPATCGRLPDNGPDVGVLLTAEALGARRCILVKDQAGLHTEDPALQPEAELLDRVGTRTLLERQLPSLIVDRELIPTLHHTHLVTEVQIVNGLRPGTLSAALAGEPVGTTIFQER